MSKMLFCATVASCRLSKVQFFQRSRIMKTIKMVLFTLVFGFMFTAITVAMDGVDDMQQDISQVQRMITEIAQVVGDAAEVLHGASVKQILVASGLAAGSVAILQEILMFVGINVMDSFLFNKGKFWII